MITLAIHGMTCPHCAAGVQEALQRVPGAGDVSVDLARGRATIGGIPRLEDLLAAVEEEGYRALPEA